MANDSLEITYNELKEPRVIIATAAILVVFYNAFAYLHPTNNDWLFDGSFQWQPFVRFLIIDQFLLESLTITVLFFLLRQYAALCHLTSIEINFRSIVIYCLLFIPIMLGAFFVFNPITQSVRFLINEYPSWSLSVYVSDYFYSWRLYLAYLPAILTCSFAIIGINLIINYRREQLRERVKNERDNIIIALDDFGEVPLSQNAIYWFEKIGRYYYVFTDKSQFRIKQNFKMLESILNNSLFVRVNRSVIVNIKAIKNYSYWENDKYILRLKNEKEFIMPRQRLRYFRKNFLQN